MRYGDACQEKAKLVLPDDSKTIANMIQEANSVLDVSTLLEIIFSAEKIANFVQGINSGKIGLQEYLQKQLAGTKEKVPFDMNGTRAKTPFQRLNELSTELLVLRFTCDSHAFNKKLNLL